MALALLLVFGFLAVSTSIASGPQVDVKVLIRDQGFYRVSKTALANLLGITEAQVAGTSFMLSNLGREVPHLRDQGDIVFFGHRLESIYSDINVYWISPGTSLPIETVTVSPGVSPFVPSFTSFRHVEQSTMIRPELIKGDEVAYTDPIYWRMFTSGLSTRFFNAPVGLTNVAAGSAGTVRINLRGGTDTSGRYYHRVRIDVNGQTQGFIDFEGLNEADATFQLPGGLFTNGNNVVRIESAPPEGTSFDSFYLNFIQVTYQQAFVAQSNRLFMPGVAGNIQVSGLTGSVVEVWNVSDRWAPRRLQGFAVEQAGALWNVRFACPNTASIAVNRLGSELVPLQVMPSSTRNLRAADWRLDHLTIAAPAFFTASQVFASHRRGQGMDAEVISTDDIYDAFNFGIRDAEAIRRFLSYAYRNWAKSPRYVMLVGDGSLDFKNQLGFNDSQIPAVPVVSMNGTYVSDHLYGDVEGDGLLEMAVGRVPANQVSEVISYADKMMNYEGGGAWRERSFVSADVNDFAGDFTGIADQLQNLIDDRTIVRADVGELGATQARERLISSINDGKELSLYIGHGTANALSLQSILSTADLPLFTNSNAPTAFVLIGCLVGNFGSPGVTNLGEGMLKARGGVANMIAAATYVSAADGQVLTEKLLECVYKSGTARMGDAWIVGKNQLTLVGRYPAYKGFQMQGDPALAIGESSSPRPIDAGAGPSRPPYEEWVGWYLSPAQEIAGGQFIPDDDDDGDGMSNYEEFVAGTSPVDPGSLLRIVRISRRSNSQVEVAWPSAIERMYRVEIADQLNGPYTVLRDNVPASLPQNTLEITDQSFIPQFIRVSAR